MTQKTVTILQDGRKIKHFICQRMDLCGRSITFHDVPLHDGGRCDIVHTGQTFYEVDHAARVAYVRLENPAIEIRVVW